MRIIAVLFIAMLAGCASNPQEKAQLDALTALEQAEAFMAGADPDAILMSLQAQVFTPDEIPDYIEEYGFRWDVADDDITDGLAHGWLAHYAFYEGDGRLPGTILLQVSRHGVLAHHIEGRALSGDGEGLGHHGPDDICFTSDSTRATFDELDRLSGVEIGDPAQALSALTIPTAFFAEAEYRSLDLVGARSWYGNLNDGYWCYKAVDAWELSARNEAQQYHAEFTPAGELVRVIDWTDVEVEMRSIVYDWTITTSALDVGSTQSRPLTFDVDMETFYVILDFDVTPSQRTTDMAFTLTAPSGAVIEPWHTSTSGATFQLNEFEHGEYEATYSFTAGLPVGEHSVTLDLRYYGPPA